MQKALPCCLTLAVLLGAAVATCAPEATDLGEEELLRRAALAVAAVADAEAGAEADRRALAANTEELGKARAGLAQALPAPPQELIARAPLLPAELPALLQRCAEYSAALEAQRKALQETQALYDTRLTLLRGALERAKALATAAAEPRPLLLEIQRRVDAKLLPAEKAVLGENAAACPQWLERAEGLRDRAAPLETELAAATAETETERKALEAAWKVLPGESPEAQRARLTMELLKRTVDLEVAETQELEKLAAVALPAAAARLLDDWRREGAACDEAGARTRAAQEELTRIDGLRATLIPPTLDALPEGEGHPELRTARRNALFAEQRVQHAQQTLDLLRSARQAAAGLGTLSAENTQAFERVVRLTARLRAAQALAADDPAVDLRLPPEVAAAALWDYARALATDEALRRVSAAALGKPLGEATALEAAEQQVAADTLESHRLAGLLAEEESYGRFLGEMAAKTEAELLELLAPERGLGTAVSARAEAAAQAEKTADAAEARARLLRETIRTIENPYAESGMRTTGERAPEIVKELEKLKESKTGQLPADRADRPLAASGAAAPPAPAAAPATPAEPLDPTRQEKARLEQEQAFAKELLGYFIALDRNVELWRTALAELNATVQTYAERLSELVNEEKRRYACARELERRYSLGRVAQDRLPGELAKWVTRDAILEAQKRRDDALRRHDQVRGRREGELKRLDAILGLRSWAEKRSTAADAKAGLIARPVQHVAAAHTPWESLAEMDQQNLQYRAEVRRREEDGTFDSVLGPLTDPRTRERFERPLEALYLEVVATQRALGELSAAVAAYGELIELCNRQREDLKDSPAALRAGEALRLQDYQAARHLAGIAAAPERSAQVESAFRDAFKRDLPLPVDTRGWALPYWADQLFAAEGRLWGHRRWIQDAELMLSKLGIDADIGRYRKLVAKLESEIEVGRARLVHLAQDLENLRRDFGKRARRDALAAILQVLLIPVAAWFVLRLLRRFVRRLEKHLPESIATDALERRRRLRTLARVAGAAVSATVWVITGIYVFRRLGVDVTPLLASAGVVGLAIAFGAQTLIKDFLAGFFILLENQFTLGDVVTIDGVGGVVERISLRVTVLRDLQGTVHYVPNGTLGRVSNMTQGWSRVVLEIGVAYRENIDRVQAVLHEVLAGLHADLPWKMWILEPPEVAGVESLGDSSVIVRVMVKTLPMKQWDLARELRKRVKTRFDAEGIEIPFPQRVVHHVSAPP